MRRNRANFIHPAIVTPLAVGAGIGFGVVLGASAVFVSPAAANAIGAAVTSVACSTTSACVSGTNASTGEGISGKSAKGIAVDGVSTKSYGVYGTSTSGVGVKAVSTSSSAIFATNDSASYPTINAVAVGHGTGVAGSAKSGVGLSGVSSTGSGVYGTSGSGSGVRGSSKNSYSGVGVLGVLDATDAPGPYAAAVSAQAIDNGYGLLAYSQNYAAVNATSDNDFALYASGYGGGSFTGSNGDAIDASTSSSGMGLYAYSGLDSNDPGTYAIFGESLANTAAWFENRPGNTSDTVDIQGGTTGEGNYVLAAMSGDHTKYAIADDNGNLYLSGMVYTAGSCSTGCAHQRVASYAPRESEPTMEDVGVGHLVAGAAYVALDPAFGNVIDRGSDYHVLVTPEGDSKGLFVAARSARGFLIRENGGGRSTVAFSYRIVAKPFGAREPRLPMFALHPATLRGESARRPKSRHPRPVFNAGHRRS